MGNIKKSKNTLQELCAQFPKLEDKLNKFIRVRSCFLHGIRLAALQIAFRACEIDDMLKNTGLSEWVLMEGLKISRRSLYNFKNLCRHCLENCPSLKDMDAAAVVAMFEKKNCTIGEQILEELGEKFPTFSIKDFYVRTLPDGEKKKKIPELPPQTVKANEIMNRQLAFQNQTGLFGLWFEESESINFLYEEAPLDDLKRAKKVADEASENLGKIIQEKENRNG